MALPRRRCQVMARRKDPLLDQARGRRALTVGAARATGASMGSTGPGAVELMQAPEDELLEIRAVASCIDT
ncbi:hypothetical protein SYNGFB01_07150 [Synechococcus sp. GFB01]|nr:hypothetical protein SYNGFB01_07150 [Synechococcus sp. GFB01]